MLDCVEDDLQRHVTESKHLLFRHFYANCARVDEVTNEVYSSTQRKVTIHEK